MAHSVHGHMVVTTPLQMQPNACIALQGKATHGKPSKTKAKGSKSAKKSKASLPALELNHNQL